MMCVKWRKRSFSKLGAGRHTNQSPAGLIAPLPILSGSQIADIAQRHGSTPGSSLLEQGPRHGPDRVYLVTRETKNAYAKDEVFF